MRLIKERKTACAVYCESARSPNSAPLPFPPPPPTCPAAGSSGFGEASRSPQSGQNDGSPDSKIGGVQDAVTCYVCGRAMSVLHLLTTACQTTARAQRGGHRAFPFPMPYLPPSLPPSLPLPDTPYRHSTAPTRRHRPGWLCGRARQGGRQWLREGGSG